MWLPRPEWGYEAVYGVPSDLNLERFVGTTLVELCLGQYQAQFHFHALDSGWLDEGETLEVSVAGGWELCDASGEVTARGERGVGGAAHVLYPLIGGSIAATDLDPPGSFALHFDDGHQLRIFDDSEDQESFSIQPGDVFV